MKNNFFFCKEGDNMKIQFYKSIKNKKYICDGVLRLLELSDNEFYPPLSTRQSTIQQDLSQQTKTDVTTYFKELKKQAFFIAIENSNVVGFMSLRYDYTSSVIDDDLTPNVYISTIIVDANQRGKGIANMFYRHCLQKFPKRHILTRTWSENFSHISLLSKLTFKEHKRIKDDRGKGIDTVYYIFKAKKRSLRKEITHYQLWSNVYFLIALTILTLLSFVTAVIFEDKIVVSLSEAISTSLLASLLCLICDTSIRYRDSKRDEYINSLKNYGISSLRFNKDILLSNILPKARHEIWISGYRLIMTSGKPFLDGLEAAFKHKKNVEVKVLVVPPYSNSYKYVYGEDDVFENYRAVFDILGKYIDDPSVSIKIKFTDIPLFNDTYKIDDRIITSPFLHARDEFNNKLTAKDFFTIDITDKESTLYSLIFNEYLSIWKDLNTYEFDLRKFLDLKISGEESVEKKHSLLKSCIKAQ